MNILPKKPSEFLDKQYWDKFFAKLKGNKQDEYFEWYGSFSDYKPLLMRLIEPKSTILNVGCGKSLLAEDIYVSGLSQDVVSCDYSEQVVKDMQARAEKKQMTLKYDVADVFNMPYKQQSFQVLIDKGTLDAVFPQGSQQNINHITKVYFPGLVRLLQKKQGSQYIVISLLQQHICKQLLNFFSQQKCFNIDIYECHLVDSKLQPFLTAIQITKDAPKVRLIKSGQKAEELTVKQCEQAILKMHVQMQLTSKISKMTQGQYFNLDVFGENKEVRYGIDVLDSTSTKMLDKGTAMVFIVPQGKQRIFLYGTQKGLRMLHEQVPCSRLIVAKMISGNRFQSLQHVKKELSPVIRELLPKGCKPTDVPFVTDSDEFGQRQYLYKDKQHIIEEIKIDDNYYRRLIIASNIGMVQSQYKLTYFSENNPQKEHLKPDNKEFNLLAPRKKGMLIGIDTEHLEEDGYERATIAGISLMQNEVAQRAKVLVLGGGACVLSKYLYDHWKGMDIKTIEIDAKIIKLAERYFEIRQDQRFRVIQYDALKYIFENSKGEQQFDLIIFDINGGVDGQPSPSPIFLSKDFLLRLQKCLSPHGLLIYHLINRDIPQTFQQIFNPIYSHVEDIVTMVYCFNVPLEKRLDSNKKQVIVTKMEYQEVQKKGRFDFEEEILRKIKIHWPKIGGVFDGAEVFVENEEGQLVNSSKNLYKQDFDKVNKKKAKRKR